MCFAIFRLLVFTSINFINKLCKNDIRFKSSIIKYKIMLATVSKKINLDKIFHESIFRSIACITLY